MTAPLRMGKATRKQTKAGLWLIRVQVHCKDFVPLDDILEYLAKKTKYSEWVSDDSTWDEKEFTWNLLTLAKE